MIPYTQAKAITFKEVTSGGGGGTPKLISLSIQTPPTTTSYKVGDTFTLDGLVLYALYEGDFWKDVTELCTSSIAVGYEFTEDDVDIDTVTLRYSENGVSASAEYGIEVKDSALPAGYTELEYIKHYAYGVMQLGIAWTNTTVVEVDFMLTGDNGTYSTIIGSYASTSSYVIPSHPSGYAENRLFILNNTGGIYSMTLGTYMNTKNILKIDPTTNLIGQTVDGNTRNYSYSNLKTRIEAVSGNVVVCPYYQSSANYARMNLYGIKVYRNGELYADLLPCYGESEGKAGMYDVIGNAFRYGDNWSAP